MIANKTTEVKILVDADSCPFKEETLVLASKYNIEVVFFTSVSHYSTKNLEKYVVVDNLPQAVDMAIINQLKPGDIVVTQDFGLAALVLGKKGLAISTRGKIYDDEKIDGLLHQRHIDAKIRRSGGKTKGPTKMKSVDKVRFSENLSRIIITALRNTSSPQKQG